MLECINTNKLVDGVISNTQMGKALLNYRDFQYLIHSEKHNKIYWYCREKKTNLKCHAKIFTTEIFNGHCTILTKSEVVHNHLPKVDNTLTVQIKEAIEFYYFSKTCQLAAKIQKNKNNITIPYINLKNQINYRKRKYKIKELIV